MLNNMHVIVTIMILNYKEIINFYYLGLWDVCMVAQY